LKGDFLNLEDCVSFVVNKLSWQHHYSRLVVFAPASNHYYYYRPHKMSIAVHVGLLTEVK
jgi:hypothetical protein